MVKLHKQAKRRKARAHSKPAQTGKLSQSFGLLVGTVLILLAAAGVYVLGDKGFERLAATAVTQTVQPTASPQPTPLLSPKPFAKPVPILTYHYIRDVTPDFGSLDADLSIPPAVFTQQLEEMQAEGFTSVTFDDVARGTLPAKPVMLTFDDGYADHYTAAFKILEAHQMKGVFYIVPGFVGRPENVTWEQVKEMSKAGMEIGAHTLSHPDFPTISPEQQHDEIIGSANELEKQLHKRPHSFAYPYGHETPEALEYLKEAGIWYALLNRSGLAGPETDPLLLPRYPLNPRTNVIELLRELQPSPPA